MDTNIKFEPSGKTSLVATGQTIWGAARSLGVDIQVDCGGLGDCDSCAVFIVSGADALSPVTEPERQFLNEERRAAGERLACQAQLIGPDVTVRVPEIIPKSTDQDKKETVNDNTENPRTDNLRDEFDKLPFDQKLSALADFGLNAAGDMVGVILKTTQRIGNELSSMFSSDAKPEHPPEPSQTESEDHNDENKKESNNP